MTARRRLVRGRQVRPVPARPGLRRGLSGVSRARPAVAGRAGGRAGRGPRAHPARASGRTRGCSTATVPEFAALLGVPAGRGRSADRPGAGAAATRDDAARGRLAATAAGGVRRRPAVGRAHAAGFIDLVLGEEPVEGLLLVGAYRDGEVDAAHPLAARCRDGATRPACGTWGWRTCPRRASSRWSPRCCASTRPRRRAWPSVIEPHTGGNPYETVELLNALRRDGLLTPRRRRVAVGRAGGARASGPLGRRRTAAARVAALPAPSRALLEAMACLGGRAELSLLQAATGEPADVVDQRLAPALDEGLLVAGARRAIRRCGSAMTASARRSCAGSIPQRRRALQLAMARRLAAGAGAVRGRGRAVPAGDRRGRRPGERRRWWRCCAAPPTRPR